MTRPVLVLLLAALARAAALSGASGAGPLLPSSDLAWQDVYRGARQAFNLGDPKTAESWLREVVRKERPWPEKVVTVDNYPETYLPFYHLSRALLKQGRDRCPEAEGTLETSIRQGVVLAHLKKLRKLREALSATCDACDSEAPGCLERAAARLRAAWAPWMDDRRETAELRSRHSRLAEQIESARGLRQKIGDPIALHLAADLATGVSARLEVLSCVTESSGDPARCENLGLADGVVRVVSSWTGRSERRGTGFVVGLGPGFADILTAGHNIRRGAGSEEEEADHIAVHFPGHGPGHELRGRPPAGLGEPDLAWLRVRGEVPTVRCLVLSDTVPATQESVVMIGYPRPFEGGWTIARGLIAGVPRQGWIKIDMNVGDGYSGSPLIRSNGQVVGLVTGKAAEAFDVGLAYDTRILKQALESWGIVPCGHDIYSVPSQKR